MSTTAGGIPPGSPDVVLISDPKNGICRPLVRAYLKDIYEALPDGHPAKTMIEPMLPKN